MYKYIKGKEVVIDEHMLSATELARAYGLYTLNNNPNGLLVARIIEAYISRHNINVSDYFYPHSKGVMKVYPSFVYTKALSDFIYKLENGKNYVYYVDNEKRKINYKFIERSGTITQMIKKGK